LEALIVNFEPHRYQSTLRNYIYQMTVSSSLNWILTAFVCWSWKLMQNLFVTGNVV